MLLNKRIPISFLFNKVRINILVISVLAISISLIDLKYDLFDIPIAATSILGTLISLVLAFRTAQAYERWWEARKIWGLILSYSRTLLREFQCFYKDTSEAKPSVDIAKRQVAWLFELGETLRGKRHSQKAKQNLDEHDFAYIDKTTNTPNAILDLHAMQIRKAFEDKQINEFQQVQLMKTLAQLCDCMGMCERIKTTVFPKTYSTLVKLLIYVFAIMIPFSLSGYSIAIEITINIILTTAFFLIEKTAIYLQDPFEGRPTDVSVTAIAQAIEINLLDMVEEDAIPQPINSEVFYVM